MKKRVRLKDIAESLNISKTTVSRALNNKFDVNEETRKAVLEKAEELNYRRNPFALSLRTNNNFTIGVILPFVNHHFFSSVLKGIMNKSQLANYLVIIGESQHQVNKEKVIMEQFVNHCVSGVIIAPSSDNAQGKNLELLHSQNIPCVMVDRLIDDYQGPYVKYDDIDGAFLATEHLIEQGYSKIACIKGNDECSISSSRLEGYKKALWKNDMLIESNLIKTCRQENEIDNGYLVAKQLLLSNSKPDAIFAVTDNIAAGIYKAAKEIGMNIPRDLGVVGYSNSKLSQHLTPSLTTVEQSGVQMGELSFDFLQQSLIDSNNRQTKCFDAKLIVRDSSIRTISKPKNIKMVQENMSFDITNAD